MITYLSLTARRGFKHLRFMGTDRITLLEGDPLAAGAVFESLLLLSAGTWPEQLLTLGDIVSPGRPLSGCARFLQGLYGAATADGLDCATVKAIADGQHTVCRLLYGRDPMPGEIKAIARRADRQAQDPPPPPAAVSVPPDWRLVCEAGKVALSRSVRFLDRTLVTSWQSGNAAMPFPKTVCRTAADAFGSAATLADLGKNDRALLAQTLQKICAAGAASGPRRLLAALCAADRRTGRAEKAPAPADGPLPAPRVLARLARLASALFEARGGLLLVSDPAEGMEREDCRLAWHLLDSLSLALGVQVFAAIPNPMLYEEAARAADGREDRVLFHLDFLLPGAQQIVRFAKERFAVGLEHPARLASLEKMRKKASEDAGRAAELDDLPRKTPPDPYLLVTAGKVRAVRGIDAGEAAALLKAAAGPSPVRDTFRPAWPASGPASLTKAPGGDHAPESGCRARCPDKGPAPAGVHVRGLRLQGLQGLQGFESLELGGLGRFTFVECAPGLDRAAIVAGLLLVSLCARPDALLELPELRGLKPTMASVRKVVTGLLRDAPHGHLTVAADCPSGLLTIALAGAGALMPDAFVAVRFADRAARLLADLRKRGQRRGVLFLKGEHGGCGTLDLSGDLPAVNWDPETFSRAVPMVRHVDAFRPADGAAAQAPACLGREDRLALDRILDGLVPDAPGLGATAPAGRPADNPAAIPIPGASPETQARAARLAAALFAARGGVLVIDNAGKGLPQTERTPLLKLVEGLARHLDVQILAFTEDPALHDAALAASGSGEDFCRLALGREKDSGDGGPGAGAESAGLTPRKDRPRLGQLPQPYPAEARLDVLEVQDFRGTRALWMSDFGSITVIMGKEGQDITLPLEACALLSVFRSPERLFLLNRLRGLPETAKGLAELARDLFGDRENRPLRVRGAVFFHEKTFETAMALGRYTKEIDSSVLPSRQEYICWPAKFGEQPPDDLPPGDLPAGRPDWPAGAGPMFRLCCSEHEVVHTGWLRPEGEGVAASWERGPDRGAGPVVVALDMASAYSAAALQARREDLLESRRQIADALQRYTCLFGLWKEAATRALDVLSATAWPAPWTEPGSVHACLGWLLLRLWEARGGILLADSLEKTLPQGRLDGLWSVLEGVGIALGVQILASTRDPQLLRAADRCLKDRSRLFLMRLPEQDGRMVAGRSLDRLDLLREPGWPGR